MLVIEDLKKIDKNSMYKVYDNWSKIATKATKSNLKVLEYKKTKEIVFVGMGGSGAINEFFASILSKTNIHLTVVKGYHLPNTITDETLIVFTSVSGNTIETLTVLELAKKSKGNIIAFSAGGKIEQVCLENNLEFRKIPMDNSPRASFVTYLYSMLKVLEKFLPIEKYEVLESIEKIEKIGKQISSVNLNEKNMSLKLAMWLDGIPMIYYPWGLQTSAVRFKNSLQENCKMHAMTEDILETSHNGIVCWEKPSVIKPILIQGEDDFEKTKERWTIVKKYFNENKIKFYEIHSEKGNIISKLICLIYVLDYATIYKSVLLNIDPTPVKSIEYIKNEIGK
jgi:glucose/mannose-6-phosphate isomerase